MGASPASVRSPNRLAMAVTVAAAMVGAVALVAAGVLWLRYGTAVFFQTLAAGLAACF